MIIIEGPEKKGGEVAMQKAGFTWVVGSKYIKFDQQGKKIVKKVPFY